MTKRVWDRRQVLAGSAKVVAGLTAGAGTSGAMAQFPPEQVLEDAAIEVVTSTEAAGWQKGQAYKPSFRWEMLNLNVNPNQAAKDLDAGNTMEGFGACFNELGWTSLNALKPEDRDGVMRELFHPTLGARFTYCRMPIGANDFSTGAYSYDETDGDFDLSHFSIDHDRATLIPFIHAAQKWQPKLKVWASPWTPPSWMKRNHFYAEAKAYPGMVDNGIRADQVGHEGEDMFLQEPRYFEAYANYFGKFIDAYKAEGIPVGMVMPQNEFNSAQNFPSCTWTAEGLGKFLHALLPQMSKRGVDVFFGTLERGNPKLLEVVMSDPQAAEMLKGVGVQWAGKNALPELHREYPAMAVYQSEQECGDGTNSWSYSGYCWELMKHYFRSGARGYMYWNISLLKGGKSTWGWAQNSLVTVDAATKTFRYTPDYYFLKHLTHFVDVGARTIEVTGTCDDVLGFVNPDKTVVLLVRNASKREELVQVEMGGRAFALKLAGDSISTVAVKTV